MSAIGDIDSVHLDDYFYPYPVSGEGSLMMPHSVHTETGSAAKRIGAGTMNQLVKDLSHD
ncbi:hypothetical protein P7H20_13645 [Paenibacillus larvae]|nr:hypothetical protein [Paenibacillus larvae]MDT2275665.1 hypothetical protein [Paenibacillus larvae]